MNHLPRHMAILLVAILMIVAFGYSAWINVAR
jgi:hypothetical protein